MIRFLFIAFCLFILFVFIFGFSVLRMFFRGIFGIKSKPKNVQQNTQTKTTQQQCASTTSSASSASQKIIASDEGEYVDYVEIKD